MSLLKFVPSGLWNQGFATVGLLLVVKLLWDIYISPLGKIPGPLFAKITNFWRVIQNHRGHADAIHLELHRKYGSAVRIGPNCVSISDPTLIRTIYSTRKPWEKVRRIFMPSPKHETN